MASNRECMRKLPAFNVVQTRAEGIAVSMCPFMGREERVRNRRQGLAEAPVMLVGSRGSAQGAWCLLCAVRNS